MRYWLVMPAAGLSSRFGADGPKQYAPLDGRTVIEWALAPFLADPRCAQIVVALARDDTGWMQVAARLAAPGRGSVTTVGGGAQRSHSVRLALAALQGRAGPDEWVLVHDAARPCLDAHDLERLLGRLGAHPGLFLTGSGFRGVGIPDCIADARKTAVRVADWLTEIRLNPDPTMRPDPTIRQDPTKSTTTKVTEDEQRTR